MEWTEEKWNPTSDGELDFKKLKVESPLTDGKTKDARKGDVVNLGIEREDNK